jgi:hypothetical protein
MLNTKNVRKFIAIRNKARLHSNLQFSIDLRAAGLEMADLGKPVVTGIGNYEWNLGRIGTLVECNGHMSLE